MVRLIRELGPLAIGVAAFGAITASLLANGNSLGNWLLAAFLIGHGAIHVMYVVPQPKAVRTTAGGPEWAFDLDHSWFAAGTDALHGFGVVLVGVATVGYVLAGLATVAIGVPADLWAPLVIVSALVSGLLDRPVLQADADHRPGHRRGAHRGRAGQRLATRLTA